MFYMLKHKSRIKTDKNKTIWGCLECVKERGYRVPLEGAVASLVTKCEYCGIRCVVVDIEDLIPANEDV